MPWILNEILAFDTKHEMIAYSLYRLIKIIFLMIHVNIFYTFCFAN